MKKRRVPCKYANPLANIRQQRRFFQRVFSKKSDIPRKAKHKERTEL